MPLMIHVEAFLFSIQEWFFNTLLTTNTLTQVMTASVLVMCSYVASLYVKRHMEAIKQFSDKRYFRALVRQMQRGLIFPAIATVIFFMYAEFAKAVSMPRGMIYATMNVFVAWFLLTLMTAMMGQGMLTRWIKLIIITVVGLNVFGVLTPLIQFLDGIVFNSGKISFSIYDVFKAVVVVSILLWLVSTASRGV